MVAILVTRLPAVSVVLDGSCPLRTTAVCPYIPTVGYEVAGAPVVPVGRPSVEGLV